MTMTHEIDPVTSVIIEQRNNALNEAAFWKAQANELAKKLKEAESRKKAKQETPEATAA